MQRLKETLKQHENAARGLKMIGEVRAELKRGVKLNYVAIDTSETSYHFESAAEQGEGAEIMLAALSAHYQTIVEATAAQLAKAEGALDA